MKVVRFIVGNIIIFFDAVFSPRAMVRNTISQTKIDAECQKLSLYEFHGCPFCVKVRRQMKRLGLRIELRDIIKNPVFEQELLAGGGQRQVPCLRIDGDPTQHGAGVRFLYESSDINKYLSERFGSA